MSRSGYDVRGSKRVVNEEEAGLPAGHSSKRFARSGIRRPACPAKLCAANGSAQQGPLVDKGYLSRVL